MQKTDHISSSLNRHKCMSTYKVEWSNCWLHANGNFS